MTVLIKNGRVIDPTNDLDEPKDLLIDKGKIKDPLICNSEFYTTKIKFDGNDKGYKAYKGKIDYGNDLCRSVVFELLKLNVE